MRHLEGDAERVGFRHTPLLRGVTIMDAEQSSRSWHVVNPTFALAVPRDWIGDLRYRGQRVVMGLGDVFCTEPGEVHSTVHVLRPGTFNVLMIADEAMRECVEHLAPHIGTPSWKKIGLRMPRRTERQIHRMFRLIGSEAGPLEVQSAMMEVYETIVEQLLDNARPRRRRRHNWSPALSRARDCLSEADAGIDLATLASEAQMSRFQLVRAFRDQYGMTPHAYSIAVRVSRAVNMLRIGMRPTEVAVECGFADQSHFNRHVKRILGVTPGQISRGAAARSF
jgi:AraC-like DNA-binding protein